MSEAIAFLLILPAMVLGLVVLNAAGTLGAAKYRTSIFTETAAAYAADTLSGSTASGAEPSAHPRWNEVVTTVKQSGLGATAGICKQTGAGFHISVISQPPSSTRSGDLASARPPTGELRPSTSSSSTRLGDLASVAVVAGCPVDLGNLLVTDRTVAVAVEPVG